MNRVPLKSPKIAYAWLAGGILMGAVAMAMVNQGRVVPTAIAQNGPSRTVGNLTSENMSLLRNLDASFANLAEYVEPAVVHIRVESGRQTDMMGRRMPQMGGEGSGVIIRSNGWILTNDHVVGGAEKVTITLSDGREFDGKVTSSNDGTDLAVVKINGTNLPTVDFADSSQVKPGQFAVAVGSPFGLENSVTVGHVSALGRESFANDPQTGSQRNYPDLIQTDAAINRGNSGGPLLDIEGRVIGINTVIYSTSGGSMGVGFAIPSNQARLTADMLIEKGKIVKGYLGLVPSTLKAYQQKELGLNGGAVVSFKDLGNNPSPAKNAGMQEGDIVTKIGTYPIKVQGDLRLAMYRYAPGETIPIEIVRNKVKKTVNVKLMAPPQSTVVQRNSEPQTNDEPQLKLPEEFREFGFPTEPDTKSEEKDSRVPPVSEKPRLGVNIQPLTDDLRKTHSIPESVSGVFVSGVETGSAAARVGIKVGDVLLEVKGVRVQTPEGVVSAMSSAKWGDKVRVKYGRYGQGSQMTSEVDVRL